MPLYKPDPMPKVCVRIPAWILEALDAEAREKKCTVSVIARRILEDVYIRRQKYTIPYALESRTLTTPHKVQCFRRVKDARR